MRILLSDAIVAGPSGFEPETAGFLRWIKVRYSTWLSYGPTIIVRGCQYNLILYIPLSGITTKHFNALEWALLNAPG